MSLSGNGLTRNEQREADRRFIIGLARQAGLSDERIAGALRLGRDARLGRIAKIQQRMLSAGLKSQPSKDRHARIEDMEASFLACLSARGLDITHIELIEQSSRRSILWPRAVFMATAQAIDPKSANLSSLARYFGYADHSSVSSVVRRTAPRALRRDETLRAASQATIDAYRHASRTIHIDSQRELSAA